jgi:hypothetical protein
MLCDHYSPSREGVGVQKDLAKLREYDEKHEGHYVETLQNLSIVNENIEILEHDPFSIPPKFNYQAFFMAEKLASP